MSTWAVVLAAVGICWIAWLVGLGLAIAVLVRRQDGVDRGRGRAVVALALCGVWAVVFVVLVARMVIQDFNGDSDDDDSAPGTTAGSAAVSAAHLEVGDCLRTRLGPGPPPDGEVVGCGLAHFGEVFARFDLPSDEYPGAKETERLASTGCASRVPSRYTRDQRRQLTLFYSAPAEATFAIDPGVTCIAESKRVRISPLG